MSWDIASFVFEIKDYDRGGEKKKELYGKEELERNIIMRNV